MTHAFPWVFIAAALLGAILLRLIARRKPALKTWLVVNNPSVCMLAGGLSLYIGLTGETNLLSVGCGVALIVLGYMASSSSAIKSV